LLHTKLSRVANALKKWSKERRAERRLQAEIENDVIFHLDLAQEERELEDYELQLKRQLKASLQGIAAIDRLKWRQRSRLVWIKAADANTKLFHLKANGRRRKNHIPMLRAENVEVTNHEAKSEILRSFFCDLLGKEAPRGLKFIWDKIDVPNRDLLHLDEDFSMDELKSAVFSLHPEKSPGPDGFIGKFYKTCWDFMKSDLLRAANQFHCLRPGCWHLLNSANIVLLPKRDGASEPQRFRPISLMHSFPIIICKLLANSWLPSPFRKKAGSRVA
jgi:hypothetical protein